jgi:hypothetical protein
MVAGRQSYKYIYPTTFAHADSGGFEKPPLRKHKRWQLFTIKQMKRILTILLLLSLVSCSNKQTGEENQNDENVFKEFLIKIPLRKLPINLACGLPDGPGSNNIQISEFETYKRFIPNEQNVIYGVIEKDEDYKMIIYGKSGDDIYPSLFIYDSYGKRIDSLQLIVNSCGGADDSQLPYSIATIDKALQITLKDSLRFIHYNDNESEYITDSIKTSILKYRIDSKGKINKI